MGSGQISDRHQKLVGDFAPGKFESLLKQFHPLRFRQRMLAGDPICKTAVTAAQLLNDLRIMDRGVHLQAIAHDHGVIQQPDNILIPVLGDRIDIKAVEGRVQPFPLLQDQAPIQSGLHDFHDQTFEQPTLVSFREAIFRIMVVPVYRVPNRIIAIPAHRSYTK